MYKNIFNSRLLIAFDCCQKSSCLFFLLKLRFFVYILLENIPLKQQNVDYTYGDGRVSNVENRTEKDKIFASPNGQPRRKKNYIKGEIKQINYFSMQKA